MKILYIPSWDLAKTVKKSGQTIHLTIECEYGKHVLEGSWATLAHHVQAYKHCPAPCVSILPADMPDNVVVAVSHLDWDVIGAIAGLIGKKKEDDAFWKAVETIDLKGPHHLISFPETFRDRMNAYWCWAGKNAKIPSFEKGVQDITSIALEHVDAVHRIMEGDHHLLEAGKAWEKQLTKRVEKCLIKENEQFRVFITNDVKCTSHYYSPTLRSVVPFIIEYNTFTKRVRLSSYDNLVDLVDIMVGFFGEGAGGKDGIACSPRQEQVEWEVWLSFLGKIEDMVQQAA